MEQPVDLSIATRDFDLNLLDEDSRDIGTNHFAEAVAAYFAHQFEPMGGRVIVGVSQEEIKVSWEPEGASVSPTDYAVTLLKEGRYEEAIPLLRLLHSAQPDDSVVLYNLGIAESDQGGFEAAIDYLTLATQIDPTNWRAYIGLGVAQQRVGDIEAAERSLERAVEVEPGDGHAHLNLGAVLEHMDRSEEAERHLREAVRLLPDNQQAVFGLAHKLEQSGSEGKLTEADALYQRAVALDPQSKIAELARRALSALAQQTFYNKTPMPVRMDAAIYCLAGLQTFAPMTQAEVEAVAMEIGMLGAQGLDINSPTSQYTLRSLPGTFSGLNLISLMYVGFKQIAPSMDIGFNLSSEYALAQEMFATEKTAQ